jgi:hypothetical protein
MSTLEDLPLDLTLQIVKQLGLTDKLSFITSNKALLSRFSNTYEECHNRLFEHIITRDINIGKTFKPKFVIRYSYKFKNYLFIFNTYCRFQVVNKYTRVCLKDYIITDIDQAVADFNHHMLETLKAREICSLMDDKFKVDFIPLRPMTHGECKCLQSLKYPTYFHVGII